MTTSTSFAQMANNQSISLSSALRANTPPTKGQTTSRKFLSLSIFFRLLLVMFLTLTVSAEVWGALSSPYECLFKTTSTLTNNQVTTGDVTWTLTTVTGKGSPTTTFGNTNGQSAIKLGSGKNNYYSKMTLKTSAFSAYNVSKVVLYISSNNGGKKTITVKQRDTQIGTVDQSFTSIKWVTNCTLNATKGSGGDLSIEISSDATATFIHSITVTYETAAPTTYTVTLNPNYPEGKTGVFKDKSNNTINGNLELSYPSGTASMQITSLYNSLTLDGYEFGGWYSAKGVNPGEVSGSKFTTTGTITGNKTYYAKWTQKVYTVTATSNNNNYGTVSVSGTTITASPKTGYTYANPAYTVTSGTAIVTQNGNTFTVSPSTNCTVCINFEELPKYTVTLVPGSGSVTDTELEEESAGAGVALPTPTICDGWTFAGWKTTSAVTTETTTKPTLIPAGAYSPTSDITLYAVYQRTEETEGNGGGSVTPQTDEVTISDFGTGTSTRTYSATYADWTWAKNSGSDIANYDEIRLYASHSMKISLKSGYTISSIVATCTKDSYANALAGSKLDGANKTVNGSTVTITPTSGDIIITQAAQSRVSKFTVTYSTTSGGGTTTTTYYHSTPECTPPCATVTIENATSIGGFSLSINTEAVTSPVENCGPVNLTITIVPYDGYQIQEVSNALSVNIDDHGTATVTYDKNSTIDSKVTLVPRSYDVVLHTNEGTINAGNVTSYEYGVGATLPTNVTKNGYVFGGWYEEETFYGTKVTTISTTETGNKEYWAKWDPAVYSITYNTNGGSAIDETSGTTLPDPLPLTTKIGYTFAGWYTDEGCTQAATAGAQITQNTILYAKWTANTYTVEFNANDGTGSMSNQSFTYGQSQSLTANAFTRTNYAFKNWNTKADGSGTAYTDKQSVSNLTTTNGETVTLYAQWTQLHTINWMVGSNPVKTETVEHEKAITETPSDPAYGAIGSCANAFMGWSETPLGSTEGQSAPADLCTAAQMKAKHNSVTGDKTFYAVFATKGSGGIAQGTVLWAENFAHFGTNTPSAAGTGTGTTIYDAASITYSQSSNNTKGYNDDIAGGTSPELLLYKGGSHTWTIAGIPTGGAARMTLSFLSNRTEFNVTSSTRGITINGSETAWNIEADSDVTNFTLTIKNTNSEKNARLDNVSVIVAEGGVSYSNYVTNCCALACATNLTVSGTTAESATLTWTAPSPTTGITKLQVRDENGNVKVNNLAANATTASITGLSECTEYTFCIASVGEDCEVVSNTVTATPFSGAKTVNYDYNGGSGSVASFTTNCNEQEIRLPSANRTGYTFKGWYDPEENKVGDAGAPYDPATSPITLHAQWTINQYTVTWNPNGGNWGGSTSNIVQTYEYGATIDIPEEPTLENGIFTGWSPEPASTMPASNKTYEAQWDMVYTLTFVDMNVGGITRTQTQQSSGESIVAPTANSEVCDMWTFIGWAPSNSLNGGTDKPAEFIAAGETILGSQITENKTYYSVYSYNSDNTQEFEVGKSGTYFMYAISGTTKYYATTVKSSNTAFYANTESDMSTYNSEKSTFILTYNTNTTKYVIKHINTTADKESEGYFYQADPTKKDITVNSSSSSSFEIAKGETQGSYRIKFTYTASSKTVTGNFGQSSSSFQGYAEGYDIFFEPASEIQYYNAADCGEVETYTMSFHNPFDDEDALIWSDAEHEEPYYTGPHNTLIDVFPTMTYNGWAFIGWTANQQYNEWIGEENLDDENSATDDPASSFTIYSNTAGWAYTLNDNVTMYPVFTKFEDNEPFDMVNGGDYYIYYIADEDIAPSKDKYGAFNRIYAGEWESGGTSDSYGATQSCASATLFTFTKLSNGKWSIYDNTKGRYLCAGTTDNNLALNATTATNGEWTITVHNGNQVNAVSKDDYTLSAQSQDATSGTFKNYATSNFNNNSAYCHRIYVGSCTERVYSSNPSNKPIIQLSGDVYVTATNARGVMATSTLKVSARKLNANEQVNITSNSNEVYFSADRTVNFVKADKPTNTLTITASPSGVIEQDIYVHYKPSAEGNGTPASVVVSANLATPNPSVTDDQTIHVRNLPAKFVIATKVGATWYALPADMSSATNPLGVVIEVDETTMTTIAPNTTTYTLWPVKTTATENDRYTNVTGVAYGDRLRFAAVNYEQRGLWANNNNNGSTIRNYAVINSLGGDVLAGYEWKITTTVVDGHWQYTLQTDQDKNQNFLRYWTSAEGTPVGPKWGTYNAGENKLYFLPVTETHPFEYAVVEWYPTKVLIQTDAAITSPTVKVDGKAVASPILTNKGGKLYEISNLPLETNPNKLLQVSFTDDAINYTNTKVVPIILSREEKSMTGEPFTTLTQKVYQYADVVVRDGATLSVDGTTDVANTLLGVTIYPTAKVFVDNGKKLSVHNLTFFGGIDEIYDGSTYELNKYGVPQLSLKGTLGKTVTTMDYIMRVNLDQMYQVGVPYDVNLNEITYWDGSAIKLGDELYVSAYDGQARANLDLKNTWIWEVNFAEKVLKAGIGYTISAEPQVAGDIYSILRMPMKDNIASGNTEESKQVPVIAYANQHSVQIADNHKGWNYLSNPYMTAISGGEADTKLVLGYLKETGTGPWEWMNDEIRYVTIPHDDGEDYDQKKFSEAELKPFKSFFVQIAQGGELSFALASRQNAPARYMEVQTEQEVEFEILLSNDKQSDNTGLLIAEQYSPAYEINADLEKMIGSMSVYTIYGGYNLAYNAISPINASEWIPMGYIAPAAGEYTFRLDDIDKIVEQVEHVYLIDYEANNIVDLMDDEYEFTTDKEQNNNRFAINVVLSQDKDNTTTGMDIINGNVAAPIKFIYHDKMYIQSGGVIYDGTGKQVTNINK